MGEEQESTDEMLYRTIGKLVRYERKRAGLTQHQLAERAGLTRTSITNLESGNQQVRVHTLFGIAEALGVLPQQLLPLPDRTLSDVADEKVKEKDLAEPERAWVKRILGS